MWCINSIHLVGVIKDVFDNINMREMEYRRSPHIRTVVIRIALAIPSGKFVENSTKLTCLENYLLSDPMQYSVMASRTSNQAW